MSRFGPDPKLFFDRVYLEAAPWDVGAPQPDLVDLVTRYPAAGPVVDLGCGTGDLAIWLAQQGLEVTGVDFAEGAIREARTRAAALPADAAARLEFRVADGFHPSALGRRFGAAFDSGFLHLFGPAEGDALAADLLRAIVPGGRLYLLEFATEFPIPNTPRAVTEEEIRARFTPERGWRILEFRSASFESRIAPVPALAACIERV